MDARRDAILRVLGVERYVPRAGTPFAAAPAPAVDVATGTADPHDAPALVAPDDSVAAPQSLRTPSRRSTIDVPVMEAVSGYDWDALERAVAACTRCGLEATRTQTVFGVGDRSPDWLVVGEAPGQEEDRRGEPFVGRAGQLLDSMLRSLKLARGQKVYIANTLKCRPPGNRDPQPREVACCMPYLQRQIALLRPKVILCVGRIAAQNLLATDAPLGKLRGRVHRLEPSGTPVVVTYHPAYLLRSPSEKRKAWTDLLYAREVASGHGA
jgi:uracil-DNA glycosylase family 4